MARQGVPITLEAAMVADPATLVAVPADGDDHGRDLAARQYGDDGLSEESSATDAAFAGGWFHTGDLGVRHPDGYIEVKDRSKDIIISGGENISSLEVEEVLYRHPKVMEAAVVARPDAKWGEIPAPSSCCARGERDRTAEEMIAFCRGQHGPLQGAEDRGLRPVAQDLDRQDPEISPAGAGQIPGHGARLRGDAVYLRPVPAHL